MAYNPTTWKDQIITDPTKYKITKENGTEELVNIEKVPGEIIQEGTRITADKLNNIEEGIKGAADLVNDLAGVGRTEETVKKNAEDIGSLSTQMADLTEELDNYNSYASNKDVNGAYTVVDFKRVDGTLYMKSTLSNADTDGNYQTDTLEYFDIDGKTLLKTETWTLTFDVDGNIISKVVN